MRCVVLAALLGGVRSWSIGVDGTVDLLDPDGPNGTLGRWPLAENLTTAEALAGGISYAFDIKLCERLMPMFPEETVLQEYSSFFFRFPVFVDCALIERTVQRAMAGWAAANTNVHFFEVTSLCNKGQGNLSPPPPPYVDPNLPVSPPSAPPNVPPSPPPPSLPASSPPGCPPAIPAPASPPANMTEEPTECDLGLKSCWSCNYAELDVSFYDSAFTDAAAAAAAAAVAADTNAAASNTSISTAPEETLSIVNISDGEGNFSNFSAFSSSSSDLPQTPSGRILFQNVRACLVCPFSYWCGA